MNPYNAYARAHELVDDNDKRKVLVRVLHELPEKIEGVKLLIAQKKYEKKYQELTKITMALEILDQSLDMSFGELPRNLSSLYRYLIRRLTEVHATLDTRTLDECKEIIGKIADGFAQAYEQVKKGSSPHPSSGPSASILSHI
ncbi:MAG: flagellar export chaperone FliS [Syntrophorhabdales bacterium]